ncbi:MAG: hypothetical protein CR996_01700 [Draconibacterium sp.]|nr:MAG: hypothetical protein CR996_01700 [Draconibacterium sp.]PIF06512.1 MAG: hypothetical protein CSA36_01320 [Draconibacterium sp.]
MVYLRELMRHFDDVVLITNMRKIKNISVVSESVTHVMLVKNEGYDMGMFYKGFQKYYTNEYSQIACVNDSNIVFNNLDFLFEWAKIQEVDIWGIVDSHEKPWFSEHKNNYHIQSHFIVFNERAIALLPSFFEQVDMKKIMEETDNKKLRRHVINDWEIGLTQFMLAKKMACSAIIDSTKFGRGNPMHKHYNELINNGLPVIKKRITRDQKLLEKLFKKHNWQVLIEKHGNKDWPLREMIEQLQEMQALNRSK